MSLNLVKLNKFCKTTITNNNNNNNNNKILNIFAFRKKKQYLRKNIFLNNKLYFKRLPFFLNYYFKVKKQLDNGNTGNNRFLKAEQKPLFVFKKSIVILKFFSGYKCLIHNGRVLKSLILLKRYSGFKFGEFIFTRRFGKGETIHLNKKKLKLNKKKK